MIRRRLLSAAFAVGSFANIAATIHTGQPLFAKAAFVLAVVFVIPMIGGKR